jgi:DNA-binding beta-propeller fold protein YncE
MNRLIRTAVVVAVLGVVPVAALASGPVSSGRLYELSDFTGTIPCSDALVVADASHDESYTIFANEVRIFNASGMQTYSFFVDPSAWQLTSLAVDEAGDLLLLVHRQGSHGDTRPWAIMHADYRGRMQGELTLTVPAELEAFHPNRLVVRAGAIWLVSTDQMIAASFSADGALVRSVDLAAIAGVPTDDRGSYGLGGFDVEPAGAVLFAVPVQFKVYVIAPDGSAVSFGRVGSGAGNFGIISGLTTDARGNIIVSDRLRNVVMIFDESFRFVREFGQSGNERKRLVRPGDLAVGASGKLYVSQLGTGGVAVFATSSEQ